MTMVETGALPRSVTDVDTAEIVAERPTDAVDPTIEQP